MTRYLFKIIILYTYTTQQQHTLTTFHNTFIIHFTRSSISIIPWIWWIFKVFKVVVLVLIYGVCYCFVAALPIQSLNILQPCIRLERQYKIKINSCKSFFFFYLFVYLPSTQEHHFNSLHSFHAKKKFFFTSSLQIYIAILDSVVNGCVSFILFV